MAPKLPTKFDDISKAASSILKDDYQCSGYQLKAKQKTSWDDAVVETTVDLLEKGETRTPAKLSWKFPKPFGLSGFAVDKLEFTPKGTYALDCSVKEAMHGVKDLTLEGKVADSKVSLSYKGFADTSIKFETIANQVDKFTGELMYGIGAAVLGAKLKGSACPTVGVNYTHGPLFAAVIAEEHISQFTVYSSYKMSDELSIAKSYQYGGKKAGAWSVGAAYKVDSTMSIKKKLDSDMNLSACVKKDLVKGFNLNGGVSYNITSGAVGYGLKVAIE